MRKSVREISGLRVPVLGARQIHNPEFAREVHELPAALPCSYCDLEIDVLDLLVCSAVVEEINRELLLRVAHGLGGCEGRAEQLLRLVVRWDENVDSRSLVVARLRGALTR